MSRRRSHTVSIQMIDQHLQLDKINHSSILDQPKRIKVIMRRTSKLARTVQIPAVVTCQHLLQIIQKQFYIPTDKQIIFSKNKRIQFLRETLTQIFSFNQKDIIHVHNKEIIQRQSTTIYLQFLNHDLIKFRQTKIQTNSNQIILNALQDSLMYQVEDIQKYTYAQSSRQINITHTFKRQAIQDDSIIIVIPKQRSHLIPLSKLQQRQIQILQSRMKLTKKTSLHLITGDSQTRDFKKKIICNVYKSMVLPGSQELIWKQDNTHEISRKVLVQKLTKKRNKIEKIQQVKQQDGFDEYHVNNQQTTTTTHEHIYFFNTTQKSQQPTPQPQPPTQLITITQQPSHIQKSNLSNLKPPSITIDLFEQLQDTDLLSIDNDNDNHTPNNGKIYRNHKVNTNKESIGSCRRKTIHTGNINTRVEFQDDGSQIMEI